MLLFAHITSRPCLAAGACERGVDAAEPHGRHVRQGTGPGHRRDKQVSIVLDSAAYRCVQGKVVVYTNLEPTHREHTSQHTKPALLTFFERSESAGALRNTWAPALVGTP
jgi:hypothetical protein